MNTLKHLFILTNLIFIALLGSAFISDIQSTVSVTTVRTNMVKTTTASCFFTVTGIPVSEKGVCCWTQPNPTVSQKKFILPSGSKTGMPAMMTGLTPGTKYFVRAFAKSGNEVIYGNEVTFTTAASSEKTNSNFGQKHEDKSTSTKK